MKVELNNEQHFENGVSSKSLQINPGENVEKRKASYTIANVSGV